MPRTDPPADVRKYLAALSAALDTPVPAAVEGKLLIGTWNLRGFGVRDAPGSPVERGHDEGIADGTGA